MHFKGNEYTFKGVNFFKIGFASLLQKGPALNRIEFVPFRVDPLVFRKGKWAQLFKALLA